MKGVSTNLEFAILQAADQNGTLRKEQLQAIKNRVDQDLNVFEQQYSVITHDGVTGTASLIIERNGQIFIEAEGTKKLVDLLHDKVLTQIFQYKENDGLILSDRIWKLTQEAKADITARLSQGILLGESHAKVAKDLRQYIIGNGGMRYKTERLTLTEMAKSYQVANQMSTEQMRQDSEYMWYEKWELSPAHINPDVCDLIAGDDSEGEGEGIYKTAPDRPHPGCYCYIYPVYRPKGQTDVTYPDVSPVKPDTTDLPQSQHKLFNEVT